MKLGKFELHLIEDGIFHLDGGAMFGVVPKVMWAKTNPADAENRIELVLQCLLIRTGQHNIVVDTGLGDKMKDRFLEIYSVDRTRNLRGGLEEQGLKPEDIDLVINTHLHFDHCGGNTVLGPDRRPVPAFPNARYIVQQAEWDEATNPNERTKASYLPENFMPIMEAGQLTLAHGEQEVIPGVHLMPTSGHTRGHQMVKIVSQGETAIYMGDLIPLVSQIRLPFVMSYDLYPMVTIEVKRAFLRQAAAEHWLLIFDHDPKFTMGYLAVENGELKLEPVSA